MPVLLFAARSKAFWVLARLWVGIFWVFGSVWARISTLHEFQRVKKCIFWTSSRNAMWNPSHDGRRESAARGAPFDPRGGFGAIVHTEMQCHGPEEPYHSVECSLQDSPAPQRHSENYGVQHRFYHFSKNVIYVFCIFKLLEALNFIDFWSVGSFEFHRFLKCCINSTSRSLERRMELVNSAFTYFATISNSLEKVCFRTWFPRIFWQTVQ